MLDAAREEAEGEGGSERLTHGESGGGVSGSAFLAMSCTRVSGCGCWASWQLRGGMLETDGRRDGSSSPSGKPLPLRRREFGVELDEGSRARSIKCVNQLATDG